MSPRHALGPLLSPALVVIGLLTPPATGSSLHAQSRLTRVRPQPTQDRVVPRVRGMPLGDAAKTWLGAGIRIERVEPILVPDGDGTVARQLPAEGTPFRPPVGGTLWVVVPRDQEVRAEMGLDRLIEAVLAARPEVPSALRVPDVVGRPLPAAESAFDSVGLEVAAVREAPSPAPQGTVVRQLPPRDRIVSPDLVGELWVSTGPGQEPTLVVVPGVARRPAGEAIRVLREAGLLGRVTDSLHSELERGRVIGQLPVDGARVPPGTAVELDVSLGPLAPDPTVRVPALLSLFPESGQRVAESLGLGLRARVLPRDHEMAGAGEPGSIVAQTPPPGEEVPPGTIVDVDVAPAAPATDPGTTAPVTPPSRTGVPAWLLPLAVAVVALLGFLRVRRARRREGDEGGARPAPEAEVVLRPRPGPPRLSFDRPGPLLTGPRIRLAVRPLAEPSVVTDGRPLTPNHGGDHA